jgi:hypothetical protein
METFTSHRVSPNSHQTKDLQRYNDTKWSFPD